MFRSVLYLQWKTARIGLFVAALAAFVLPILSVGRIPDTPSGASMGLWLMQSWGVGYPLLAAGVGLLLATTAWFRDHRGEHVYALTLPVPRWQYALLGYGAGALLLAIPVAALAAGTASATLAVVVPSGLTAYPGVLTFKFALASLLAFSMFFAVSAGTSRSAGIVLGFISLVFFGEWFVETVGFDIDIIEPVVEQVVTWPGPLDVFGGRWMLFDF